MKRELLFQTLRFAVVGGAATLTNLLIAWAVWKTFNLHETAAVGIGFVVAFFVSYFGHRFFTFRKFGGIFRFFLLSVSMLGAFEILVFGLTTVGVRGFWAMFIPLAAVTLMTFVASKYAVFKGGSASSEATAVKLPCTPSQPL